MNIGSYIVDDDIIGATKFDGLPRIRLFAYPRVTVVLGRGGSAETELKLSEIETDKVSVLRRLGGGCAVVLDQGNAVLSVVLPLPGIGGIKKAFNEITAKVIEWLETAGIPNVKQQGISDLTIGDQKIGGSCIYRTKNLIYYSTTFLVTPNLELVEKYLRHPPREPDYRQGRTHQHFMGSLAKIAGVKSVDEFLSRLRASSPEQSWLSDSVESYQPEIIHHQQFLEGTL